MAAAIMTLEVLTLKTLAVGIGIQPIWNCAILSGAICTLTLGILGVGAMRIVMISPVRIGVGKC